VVVAIYVRATRARSRAAAIRTWILVGVLVALTLATPLFPVPPSDRAFGVQALVLYGLLAAAAEWIDRGRAPRLVAVPQEAGGRKPEAAE